MSRKSNDAWFTFCPTSEHVQNTIGGVGRKGEDGETLRQRANRVEIQGSTSARRRIRNTLLSRLDFSSVIREYSNNAHSGSVKKKTTRREGKRGVSTTIPRLTLRRVVFFFTLLLSGLLWRTLSCSLIMGYSFSPGCVKKKTTSIHPEKWVLDRSPVHFLTRVREFCTSNCKQLNLHWLKSTRMTSFHKKSHSYDERVSLRAMFQSIWV